MIWLLRRDFWLVLSFVLAGFGCSKEKTISAATEAAPERLQATAAGAKAQTPVGPEMHVDAFRVMQYTKKIVAFGPRWDGSKAIDQVRAYIKNKLRGDQVEEDAFVAETSIGKLSMHNIVAKFPGMKDGIIVLGSHYETNYWLKDTSFVGANDGACTSALLLAIADELRKEKLEGYSIWLAFFDGEESMTREWNTADALWGSRHLAQKWQRDGTSKKVKAFLLLDMLGDANLKVIRDQNSTAWLEDLVLQAATHLGYQSLFYRDVTAVQDDHIPFVAIGVPVADVIDGPYGYNDSFHHTPDDTVDKLSVRSLRVSGDVVLETIRLLNGIPDNASQ